LNLNGIVKRQPKTIELEGSTVYSRKYGQFIYGKQNFHKGCFGIVPKEIDNFNSSNDLPSFDCGNYFNVKFVYYYFSLFSRYSSIESIMSGTGSKRLSENNFLNVKLWITDLKEQNKIVIFFTLIDKQIELLNNKLRLTKLMKKYYLNNMFTFNKNIPQLRFREFNENWILTTLEFVCDQMKSGGTPTSTKLEYYNGNIPFISIPDMNKKYLYKWKKQISELALKNSSSYILEKNNLLLSIYATIGVVCINKVDIALPQSILGIKLKKEFNIEFIFYILLNLKKEFVKMQQTGSQPNISLKIVKNIKFLLPSKREEQNKIGTFLL